MEIFTNNLLLLDKLGEGGMAEVFMARQYGVEGFQKIVAVKRVLPDFAEIPSFKKMFQQEANLAGLLTHPNIVQVLFNGSKAGYIFLVMEFVDGQNLSQLLTANKKRGQKIPARHVAYIISQTLKGLDYAHEYRHELTNKSMHIVHRDMSPQNIMLGYSGEVKLVDFGIAKNSENSGKTKLGTIHGKYAYLSPEHASGGELDRRSDIFSVGIVLWEALTGERLFSSSTDMETIINVKESQIEPPSVKVGDLHPGLDEIVMHSLKRERADRYSSAREMHTELDQWLRTHFPEYSQNDYREYLQECFQDEILAGKERREEINLEIIDSFGTEVPAAFNFDDRTKIDESLLSQSPMNIQEMAAANAHKKGDNPSWGSTGWGPMTNVPSIHAHGRSLVKVEGSPQDLSPAAPNHINIYVQSGGGSADVAQNPLGKPVDLSKIGSKSVVDFGDKNLSKKMFWNGYRRLKYKRIGTRLAILFALHIWLIGLPSPRNYREASKQFNKQRVTNYMGWRLEVYGKASYVDITVTNFRNWINYDTERDRRKDSIKITRKAYISIDKNLFKVPLKISSKKRK